MPLRERERERKKKYFCPTYGPKRKKRKTRVLGGGKKSKVSCLARNRSMGVKQVVFYEILFD